MALTELAVLGSHIIWKVRPWSKATTQAAAKLALQLDGSLDGTGSTNRKATKDGTITSRGQNEHTVDITYVASRDDVNQEIYDTFMAREELEMWRIDTGTMDELNKCKATYVRGFITGFSLPDNVDDTVDSTTSLDVTYGPVDGTVTLSEDDIVDINTAFTFIDTVMLPGD